MRLPSPDRHSKLNRQPRPEHLLARLRRQALIRRHPAFLRSQNQQFPNRKPPDQPVFLHLSAGTLLRPARPELRAMPVRVLTKKKAM